MTYAYGTKGAPAVGGGLGGLPRRSQTESQRKRGAAAFMGFGWEIEDANLRAGANTTKFKTVGDFVVAISSSYREFSYRPANPERYEDEWHRSYGNSGALGYYSDFAYFKGYYYISGLGREMVRVTSLRAGMTSTLVSIIPDTYKNRAQKLCTDGERLISLTGTTNSNSRFIYTDDGVNWDIVNSAVRMPTTDIVYGGGLWLYFASGRVPLRSQNGANWSVGSALAGLGDITNLVYCESQSIWVASSDRGGVYYSNDGVAWSNAEVQGSPSLFSLNVNNSGSLWVGSYIASDGVNLVISQDAKVWKTVPSAQSSEGAPFLSEGRIDGLRVKIEGGDTYLSTNGYDWKGIGQISGDTPWIVVIDDFWLFHGRYETIFCSETPDFDWSQLA